jgi:hypothetical protein
MNKVQNPFSADITNKIVQLCEEINTVRGVAYPQPWSLFYRDTSLDRSQKYGRVMMVANHIGGATRIAGENSENFGEIITALEGTLKASRDYAKQAPLKPTGNTVAKTTVKAPWKKITT